MSRIKKNPYGSNKVELVPVVQMDDRSIWFAKVGSITPDINPVDQQEREKKKARITALLFEAGDELARQKGISPEDARQLFFPKLTKDGQEVTPLNFFDYLSKDDKAELLLLQSETQDIEIMAATLFMRYRLAYEIVVTENSHAKARQLYVQDPWFDVHVGDTYKTQNGLVIEITEAYDPESGSIGILPVDAIEAGTIAFLYNKVRHSYTLGDKDWTVDDTRQFMTTSTGLGDEDRQIQLLYHFYQEEAGLRKPGAVIESEAQELADTSEGNELETMPDKPLQITATQPLSTGVGSTSDYNTWDAETNGSTAKTLVLSPTG
jgi:hypothetical protein